MSCGSAVASRANRRAFINLVIVKGGGFTMVYLEIAVALIMLLDRLIHQLSPLLYKEVVGFILNIITSLYFSLLLIHLNFITISH